MPNHPAPPLSISESERASLRALLRAGTTEQRLVMRARIVLAAADGTANERIAAELGVHRMTVLLWRGRFERERMAGLADAPRPGREPTYDRAARDRVIAFTLEPPPFGTTHWSSRAMAARTGISVTTVQRIWREANLKPHRTETFKFSTDPDLVAKVRDVVGLYLAPPERAIVLSRRREDPDPGSGSNGTDAADEARARSSAIPTTTSATAPRTSSPLSKSPPAR